MRCENCGVESDEELCSPCRWLYDGAAHPHPSWDRELRELARCGPTNRRWQMRFHRGEIPAEGQG